MFVWEREIGGETSKNLSIIFNISDISTDLIQIIRIPDSFLAMHMIKKFTH